MKSVLPILGVCCLLSPLIAAPNASSIIKNIKVDQFGYTTTAVKTAVISQPQSGANVSSEGSYTPSGSFQVRRWSDDVSVYSGSPAAWNSGATHSQSGDKVWWFTFTSVTTAGDYYIWDVTNQKASYRFTIGDDVYNSLLKAACKMLYYQRDGVTKPATYAGVWADNSPAHLGANQDLDCRLITDFNNTATSRNLSGGWWDAGDMNKYVNFVYGVMHNLLFAYQENPTVFGDANNIPESANGVADLLDEMKIELNWLVKMQEVMTGAVYSKVSVTQYQAATPASSDNSPRYYGAASTGSTLTVASIFAHAAIVYRSVGQTVYADSLLAKSKRAYDWAVANPSVGYSNAGFSSANPEVSSYDYTARQVGAAVMLYDATGLATYKNYVDVQYLNLHPMQWYYFYTYEMTYGDMLIHYSLLPTATASVAADIKNRFQSSVNTNGDFYTNFTSSTDAYRAYLKTADYQWGSNQTKSLSGAIYTNMIKAGLSTANQTNYQTQAQDYLHYIHGVNPLNIAMLTNTASLGADNCATMMYHTVYGENSAAWTSNPPPAYVTGGINPTYSGGVTPPTGEPTQKAYKDWNTGYPQSSWEITEPALYYQAAYIRLLSKFASSTNVTLPLELLSFDALPTLAKTVRVVWATAEERNVSRFEVERSRDAVRFERIGTVKATNVNLKNIYALEDKNISLGTWYYRLKMIDVDEMAQYSNIVSIEFGAKNAQTWRIYPNPVKNRLVLENNHVADAADATPIQIEVYNACGQLVCAQKQTANTPTTIIETNDWQNGVFFLRLTDEKGNIVWQQHIVK